MQAPSVTSSPIRVQVVAQALVAWGLERLIESARPRLCVVGSGESLEDCVAQLQRNPADVVLLDLDSEGDEAAVARLFAVTQMPILAICSAHRPALQDSAVLAGARGVFDRRESPALLLKALEKVHEGELWVGRSATGRLLSALARERLAQVPNPEAGRIASLTPRERQAIAALAGDAAAPGKVIAARLHISEHTLRNHLTVIYSKLGVPNRLALYAYARANGLAHTA
jgi:two-component system, NarL family, nitrate/nitrite response regulator NarL